MLEHYNGIDRDEHGDEAIVIQNDGKQLFMTLRGVEFTGHDPMNMSPANITERPELDSFILKRYSVKDAVLCGCAINYEVPASVVVQQKEASGILTISVDLGMPSGSWRLDRQDLRMSLQLDGKVYLGHGKRSVFEDELQQLQASLPEGVYMNACINCAFSDYSVYGQGVIGMICYRNNKAKYLAVKSKDDYMDLMDASIESTECVQETYLCPEFERRVPGPVTGVRNYRTMDSTRVKYRHVRN